MCEIVMLIFGIITLIRGKFTLTRGKEVRGVPARIIGLVLALPFPLSFALIIFAGIALAIVGKPPAEEDLRTMGIVIEVVIVGLCFIAAIGIANVYSQPVSKQRADENIEEVDLPERYHEHFQAEEDSRTRPRADGPEVTDQPPRPSARPEDDRIRD